MVSDRVIQLDRVPIEWANVFSLGPVRQTYLNVDVHARHRFRHSLCVRHKFRVAVSNHPNPATSERPKLNRRPVKECGMMLLAFLPVMIGVMIEFGVAEDWGRVCFRPEGPVVNAD
jgi:hypothetical protein